MIRHLFKLVWRRKRVNALLIVEIFFSFVVLFAVATTAVFLWNNYRRPLGFDYTNLWNITIDRPQTTDDETGAGTAETFSALLREVQSFPEVVLASAAGEVPYDGNTSRNVTTHDGRRVFAHVSEVADSFAETVGLELTRGRWFEEGDQVKPWEPLVVNELFVREIFGDEDPIGKPTSFEFNGVESRVIGVVTDYRKAGEFSSPVPFMFLRIRVADSDSRPPRNLLLKMAGGVDPVLEQRILDRLRSVARGYSFEAVILPEMRETRLRLTLAPLLAGGVVAGFLLVMVGLGLIGVLWQNVTQRTREIGLRRATGASAGRVKRQILGELWILTTLGLLLGVALLVQLPILDLVGFVPTSVFTAGIVVSCVSIYTLALVSGLYPSWLATRVRPAEALHYE